MFEIVDYDYKVIQKRNVYIISICKKENNTYEWEDIKTVKYEGLRPSVFEMDKVARIAIKGVKGAM